MRRTKLKCKNGLKNKINFTRQKKKEKKKNSNTCASHLRLWAYCGTIKLDNQFATDYQFA
jgi:hypothetical protein